VRLRIVLLAFLLLSVSGCSAIVIDGCGVFREIQPSREDVLTPGTEDQIITHNWKIEEFCR
jgi:hypothetical protein